MKLRIILLLLTFVFASCGTITRKPKEPVNEEKGREKKTIIHEPKIEKPKLIFITEEEDNGKSFESRFKPRSRDKAHSQKTGETGGSKERDGVEEGGDDNKQLSNSQHLSEQEEVESPKVWTQLMNILKAMLLCSIYIIGRLNGIKQERRKNEYQQE